MLYLIRFYLFQHLASPLISLSMKDNIRIEYFGLISSKVLSVTSLLNFQNSINLKMSELGVFTLSNNVNR